MLIICSCVQTIGDAISVILMVLAALAVLGMALPDWAELYSDVPSRQLKASCLHCRHCATYRCQITWPNVTPKHEPVTSRAHTPTR